MKGKLTKIFMVSSLASVVVACQAPYENSRVQSVAPITQEQAGVIVNSLNQENIDAIMAEFPEAKLRVVSKKHGIYEIFNVPLASISEMGLSADVSRNIVYQTYNSPKMEPLNTNGEIDLSVCKRSFFAPKPKLTLKQADSHIPVMSAFLKGSEVTFSGEKSTGSPMAQGALKMAWEVVAPEGSQLNGKVEKGSELKLNLSDMGVYQVYLIVQDSKLACQASGAIFIVTNNPGLKEVTENIVNLPHPENINHLMEINAAEAWEKSKGEGIKIAIVDTGVNYNHPSLQSNILVNKGEIPNNNIDDDNNGYIDDYLGYDFVFGDGDAYDDGSHGTHVAGLAAGKSTGVAPSAQIIPVKALSAVSGDAATIAAAIYYAVDRGADVINLSLGGYGEPHPELIKALAYAEDKKVLVIAASGNGHPQTGLGVNIDVTAHSPGGLGNSNLITVGAHADGRPLTSYSNFGKNSVDIVAPGGSSENPIISSRMENPLGELYEGMSGTSMASPIAAGVAALVKSANPDLSISEIKSILKSSGQEVFGLDKVTQSGRHLSALDAVNKATPSRLALLPHLFN